MTLPMPEGAYADVGGGRRLHYHQEGEGGLPVVFLHGSGPGASGWSNFRHNAPAFAAAGYRAIMPDILGYGLSSKPTDVGYSLEMLAETMWAALDAIGVGQCVLVGNSMGGALSILMTLNQPDRVQRLVLMAPGGLEERDTYMQMRGIRRMMRALYGPEGLTRFGMQKVFEVQLYDPSGLDQAVIDRRFALAQAQPIHVFKTLRVTHLADRLSELTCPVFGLWGADDQFCPVTGAERIARSVPDARVITFSRCGHWVMVERTALFNRLCLEFLAGEL